MMATLWRLLRILLWDAFKLCLWLVLLIAVTGGIVYSAAHFRYADWVFGGVILALFLLLVVLMSADYIDSIQTRLKPKQVRRSQQPPPSISQERGWFRKWKT